MKNLLVGSAFLAAVVLASPAAATPLSLNYVVTPTLGGQFHYDFTLTLTDQPGFELGIRSAMGLDNFRRHRWPVAAR